MDKLSIYLHIPFCQQRCGYCDFNTYAGLGKLIPAYVQALAGEIRFFGSGHREAESAPLHSIYLGGGTPSLLSVDQISFLLGELRDSFQLSGDCEITIEANPGTVSLELLDGIRSRGVNRVSLGVQSSIPEELHVLDRQHGFPEAELAVKEAREAGFENISLDLIYGIPGQTPDNWKKSLEAALSLSPEHLSLYSLTVEPGTPLAAKVARGEIIAPDDDLAADMYDLARAFLGSREFVHYEISNWALKRDGDALVSRHNRQYWRNLPYLGLGAGAHGYYRGIRYGNVLGVAGYIQRMGGQERDQISPAATDYEMISTDREMRETMMMGLRLLQEGVDSRTFEKRFGVRMEKVFSLEIKKFLDLGLLEWVGGKGRSLVLTPRGYLLGNQVFGAFV